MPYVKLGASHRVLAAIFSILRTDQPNVFNRVDRSTTSRVSEKKVSLNRSIVTWLSFKNLPKNFFNDEETKNFFALFNKEIQLPSRSQMHTMIKEEFKSMQDNVISILEKNDSKFAFTLDAWSGRTRKSYYGVTIHFIDKNWTLNSFTLDFRPSKGKHSGKDIADIFYKILKTYKVQNSIAGITLDNASANTKFITELSKILEKDDADFDREDQHFRCLAHVLNLGVQDILKLMEFSGVDSEDDDYDSDDYQRGNQEANTITNVVNKIRQLHKKIRNSEALSQKLEGYCIAFEVEYKTPPIDSKTRWNSTFDMLDAAHDMKDALNQMTKKHDDLGHLSMQDVEWNLIKILIEFLSDFKKVSTKISGEKYVTLPSAVIAFNCLLNKIERKSLELNTQNKSKVDEKLITAFQKGEVKLLTHYKKCNWIYCISLILDPRIKAVGLQSSAWGTEMADTTLQKFKDIFKKYYDKYFQQEAVEQPAKKKPRVSDIDLDYSVLFVRPEKSVTWMTELNRYLEDPRPDEETDILQWWKLYAREYPITARIARDVLCIPATSVPCESDTKEYNF
ncbi:unnamed protein product [Trichogramma brassicae]|uniref:HAT C-terminal dimerisation domain-containing protein n=1 Tax=Trichogramma brassicae TaxID=86971 RepID=A0A6H5I4Y5_9HYME|nr:unnamed protein product [Trichogramma brassicae]